MERLSSIFFRKCRFYALVSGLVAAGFQVDDDYSTDLWIEGQHALYSVHDDFPRLTSNVPVGISKVRYAVALNACEPYRAVMSQFLTTVEGVSRGHHN